MTLSTAKKQQSVPFNPEPVLRKVLRDAKKEHQKLQEVFELMGWGELPDALKIEIKDDVKAMVDECRGRYSTCDPFVLKRRQRIIYWIENYQEKMCSLQTAVEALRIKSL